MLLFVEWEDILNARLLHQLPDNFVGISFSAGSLENFKFKPLQFCVQLGGKVGGELESRLVLAHLLRRRVYCFKGIRFLGCWCRLHTGRWGLWLRYLFFLLWQWIWLNAWG